MSVAYSIAQELANDGVGTIGAETGWCITVGTQPETPDACVTIYDTGGAGPESDDLDDVSAAIQVRVRARTYLDAYAKAREVRDLLLGGPAFILSSDRFYLIHTTSDIASLGLDDNKRTLLVASYEVRYTDQGS